MATVNTNIMNTTSITSSSSTTAAIAAGGGDMIHNNNNNNNTRHRGGGGGSRVVSSSSAWTQIVRGDSLDAIGAIATTVTAAAVTPSPSSAAAREVSMGVSEQPGVVVGSGSASSSGSSSVVAEDERYDGGNGANGGNAGKRPAWNKPSNGAVEVGAVMGAFSWPALSESAARVSGKPTQQDSSSATATKAPLSDGSSSSSASVPQGTGSASSSSSNKQVSHNANSNSSNHTMPARQRSMKRNSGANTSSTSNGSAPQPPGPQQNQNQTGEVHLNNNPSPRDHTAQRNSQPRSGNDHPQHQQQRNSFRRNGGPHVRDGPHHHNYGGRRDQDRQNQDWNNHRSFSGRDAHMQPQRVVPRYTRHPPPPPPPPTTSTTFMGPPALRAFGSPIGFHEIASPVIYLAGPPADPLRSVPFVTAAPISPMYFAAPDPQLHLKIMSQIEYYFSNENLIKDTFLRQNMDDQGWVPIQLIAGFKMVSSLTDNIQLILDAVKGSTVVEVQADKVRRRDDWKRWLMPPAVHFQAVSGPPSLGRFSQDMLAAHVQSISLVESATSQTSGRSHGDVHNQAFLGESSSEDSNNQSQVSSSEGTGQVSVQGSSDSSVLMRNPSK